MTDQIIKYDEACRMLAEAVAVDEVIDVRNKANAMRIYARQAKNRDLEINAAQIRVRAERRLGEMLIEQRETVGLATGAAGIGKSASAVPEEYSTQPMTLAEAGIDRKLSSRAQRTAEIGPIRFEALMAMMREQAGDGRVIVDILKIDAENEQRQKRRDLARAMSEATALSPSGQKVACVYADPAWKRNQGVTNRSYENHYPTMSWDDICAMPVADRLLPDAWLFLWIPRAHMFALHKVQIEVMDVRTGEMVLAEVAMPLGWAVAQAWGFDAYSTAFVWTKTDEDHPFDQGGGVLVYDQDEVLLMFKRGRGLPKPATGEKFQSNHRERKREHSRKPDHYRDMIRSMTGGVPVLELFARVDEEHPLPPDWIAWGNQSQAEGNADAVPAPVDPVVDSENDAPDTAADHVLGTAGEYAIVQGPAFVPRDFLTPSEQLALEVFESLPLLDDGVSRETESVVESAAFETHLDRISIETRRLIAEFLSDDEFEQWYRLRSVADGRSVDGEAARGLIGSDYVDVIDDGDALAITDSGGQWLSSLETYVFRCAAIRAANVAATFPEPHQIDLEELIAGQPMELTA